MDKTEEYAEKTRMDDFLVAHGGPFYELQRQLGLLREDSLRAGSRAVLFVAFAWGVPLVLSMLSGNTIGPAEDKPYLLQLDVWARFFIAVGLFILMERQVEHRLRAYLMQFARVPLLAPNAFTAAAEAVSRALQRRDAHTAEIICLILAVILTLTTSIRLLDSGIASWAVKSTADSMALTPAGWWVVVVSTPIFWFLLLRWLWRTLVWGMLLRALAALELRLIATHPDGRGGLAFLADSPRTYIMFVFALSCVLGAAVANQLLSGALEPKAYSILMGAWLLIVMIVFASPLLAFRKPLSELKEQTLLACSTQATRHLRAAERELLGRNISAAEDAEPTAASEIPDPSKVYTTSQKLSVMLVSHKALLPIAVAALLPLAAAGVTQLPLKEVLGVVKRLLFI